MTPAAANPPERGPLDAAVPPKDVLAFSDRDRIVQAMAATCAERGYAETTVAEVCRRAGVSEEAFAESFTDLEDCGLAAVNLILSEATAVASAAWSPDSSEWESILRGVRALLELMAAQPSFARLSYIQARYAMPPSCFETYASGIKVIVSMIDRLRPYAPDEAQPPQPTARAVLGGGEILIQRALAHGEPERIPELLPAIIYGTLVPFLGPNEAQRYMALAREALNDGR